MSVLVNPSAVYAGRSSTHIHIIVIRKRRVHTYIDKYMYGKRELVKKGADKKTLETFLH